MILEQLEIVQMNSLLRDQDFVDKLLFFYWKTWYINFILILDKLGLITFQAIVVAVF